MDIKDLLLKLSPYPVYVIVLYEKEGMYILVWLLKNETKVNFFGIWKCPNKTLILRINILIQLNSCLEWVTYNSHCTRYLFGYFFLWGSHSMYIYALDWKDVYTLSTSILHYTKYIFSFHCNIFTEPHINLISIYVFLLPHSRNTKYIEIQLNISSTYIGS